MVYALFFTNLPQQSFTACDVVESYLHRRAFEPTLCDEDNELDPDRWCSHSPCGQECWQLIAQWVWNLRLELGHVLTPQPVRTTELAPPLPREPAQRKGVGYSEPTSATRLGKRVASLARTFPFNLMGACAARLARACFVVNDDQRLMAASLWSMRLGSRIAGPAPCANNASGMGRRPNILAESV